MASGALITLLILGCEGVVAWKAGMAAVLPSEAQGRGSHLAGAGLSFEKSVAFQRGIEEVYWRHRIWPRDNPGPNASLAAVIKQGQLEKKVGDCLGKSRLVAAERGWPISPRELQAEMDRMAWHSMLPEMLRELFATLGNDPLVIAEYLARPILAERLTSEASAHASGTDGPSSYRLSRGGEGDSSPLACCQFTYTLPEIPPADCADDTWTVTPIVNAPRDAGLTQRCGLAAI